MMNEHEEKKKTGMTAEPPLDASPKVTAERPQVVEHTEDLATRALLARPGLSIRARFIIGFLVIFFAAAVVTVAAWVILFRLDNKLEFVDRADKFANEIQQCRRYEKNFFLYGTGLSDALKHLDSARKVLIETKTELGRIVGVHQLEELELHLEAYSGLIFQLLDIQRGLPPGTPPNEPAIENRLREHGSRLVDTALLMSRRERNDVRSTLHLMRRLNLIALAILLIGLIYMANFLTRHFLRRLDFLMGVTQRIGEGDFRPIMPVRKYKDEFTNLSLAMNHMMNELANRQEQLVQARKIAAVGTLTAGIAHEINNPVNNISLILESLAESAEGMDRPERERLYQEGMEQCERVSDIVKNLLEFSRASHPRLEQVSLEEIVDKTAQLVANEMKLNEVRFAKEVRHQLPELQVDKGGLQQVLLNLFLNSIQAMPGGGELKVVIRMSKAMNEGIIEVRDTGEGIPQEHLHKIFDPFYTTRKDGEGTGLGLSVSYSIIEKHGGRIEVQSKPGEGTTFSIILPFERPPF